jgi:NAD(P)-dependent dehydrogenase (short-subunit alcohol dehydrogenase family)
MGRLDDRTALVTGGGSGIGLAVARALLAEGAKVAITGRTADKLRTAAESLAGGDRVFWHAADLSEPGPARDLVARVRDRLGPIDILVNNAGLNVKERGFRELTPENWDLLVRGNLYGAFYVTQAAWPQLAERRGLVVAINSVSGKRAGPLGGCAYDAGKFGLRGLMTCIAAEEKASGVRVTSIYPGEVETPILDARPVPVTAEQRRDILQPEDIAEAVLFVALLPPRAWVPELVITPVKAAYV